MTNGRSRSVGKKGAVKLWELHHKFHCPVIGTCLHVDELRKLASGSGAAGRGRCRDHWDRLGSTWALALSAAFLGVGWRGPRHRSILTM